MFSSNTSTTKPGGLFGNTGNQQQQVSQFGTTVTSNSTAPAQTGGLFGSTNNTTTGLFGNSNTGSATSGGLFGTQTPAATTGTGLFGNKQPATSNTGTGGGLFGTSNQPTTGGGLFGTSNQSATSGGLFGSSNQPATGGNLFSTTTSNPNSLLGNSGATQKSLYAQQQYQMQPELLSTTRQRKLIVEQPKILPSWTKISDSSNQMPREVIRRLTNIGKEGDSAYNTSDVSDSDNEFEEDIFGNVGFGKSKKLGSKRTMNKKNMSLLELDSGKDKSFIANNNIEESGELPPTKSLFDIEKEMEIEHKIQQSRFSPSLLAEQTTKKLQQDSTFKKMNIFDRSDSVKEPSSNTVLSSETASKNNELYECLLFGYPENISTQILTHFNKFGFILEDFPFLAKDPSASKNKKLPIKTGESWCKITYDNKVSYLRALKENGTLYAGYVIGCVPYAANHNEKTLNDKSLGGLQPEAEEGAFSSKESKDLNESLLVADIFQKSGIVTSMDAGLRNEKEKSMIGGKLNEFLFGFNGDNI